MKIAIGYYK